MPDMAHSIAYEANVYFNYYFNTWDSASVKKKYALSQPGLPVDGTVPRGYAGYELAASAQGENTLARQMATMRNLYGMTTTQGIRVPVNGSTPYRFNDTEAGRQAAINAILTNPFPITEDGLTRGKELYETFCGICHGNDGGGGGWIYENEAYPAAPRNFLVQEWADTSAGTYYHSIMHGKNVMGAYADKMSYEERWQVIHYIRALQAKALNYVYTPDANTMNPREATPIGDNALYAAFLESFSREPMDYESAQSQAPDAVPGTDDARFVPQTLFNAIDSAVNGSDRSMLPGGSAPSGKTIDPATRKAHDGKSNH